MTRGSFERTSVSVLAGASAVAVALLLSACGGDDSSSPTGDSAIEKVDFIAQADDICTASNQALQQAAGESFAFGGKPSGDELGTYVADTFIPLVQGRIDDIRALGAPAGEEDQVEEFLTDAQAALDDLEEDPKSLSADTFHDVNEEAAALGLKACSN